MDPCASLQVVQVDGAKSCGRSATFTPYINLINFSAVTIFLAKVVHVQSYFEDQIDCVLRKDFNHNFHENQTTGATDEKKILL